MSRRGVAVGVLALWGVALALLARREFGKSDDERLAESARRIYPTAYYYLVYQGERPIGSASSQMDTAVGPGREFRVVNRYRGTLPFADTLGFVQASSIAYLSRRFVLDSFLVQMIGGQRQFRVRRVFPKLPRRVPPPVVPMLFMLGNRPAIGRSQSYAMYEPMGDSAAQVTLRVAAESLFTVSDSARYDSTARQWRPAHMDTVRSWSVAPSIPGFTVWVDAQGRLVSAAGPLGLHLIRTAYEIAFANWSHQYP